MADSRPVTAKFISNTVEEMTQLACGLKSEIAAREVERREAAVVAKRKRHDEAEATEREVSCLSSIWQNLTSIWRPRTGSVPVTGAQGITAGEHNYLLRQEPAVLSAAQVQAEALLGRLPTLLHNQSNSRLRSFENELASLDQDSAIGTWASVLASTEGYVYVSRIGDERLQKLWLDLYEAKRWAKGISGKGDSSRSLATVWKSESIEAEKAVASVQALLEWMKGEAYVDTALPSSSVL